MLCGVTATLGSNPSATATAARPQWGRAVLLCLDGVWARARARVCVLGPGCLVCPWAAGYLADGLACGAAGVPGAIGPGRPRDRHTRACGSEWSISKPARALRPLRHPPHRRRLCRCVWLGASSRSPARPRRRPRAPQPGTATLWSCRHPPYRRRLCRCAWLGASSRSPARPRRRPRAPQPGTATLWSCRHPPYRRRLCRCD